MESTVTISVVGLGVAAKDAVVEKGVTIADALTKLGMEFEGMHVTVNGNEVVATSSLEEDAIVTALPDIEGGC